MNTVLHTTIAAIMIIFGVVSKNTSEQLKLKSKD